MNVVCSILCVCLKLMRNYRTFIYIISYNIYIDFTYRRSWYFIAVAGPVTSLQVRPSTTIYGLVITWGPPSSSNYSIPVTYRVRYGERPSSGPPGSWSSTVVRSATQREYTTPTLKQGTRYEVEVWAVSIIGEGTRETQVNTTYQGGYFYTATVLTKSSLKCQYCSCRSSDIPPNETIHYHIWTNHNMGTNFW